MNNLISIIVPVYKVESYLYNCLDSILKQSYTNFEVLLINDGSTDNSELICIDFVNRDNRFKYYYKENGGVSSARNLGLQEAIGRWIVFVDSDDIIEENYLNDFVINFQEDKSILLLQDFKRMQKGELIERFQNYNDSLIIFPEKLDEFINNYKYTQGYLWNKMFNAEIIKFNDLRFDEDLSLCEDEVFYHIYIRFIGGVKIIPNDNYIYFDRVDSLTKSNPKFENQLKYMNYSNDFLDYLSNYLYENEFFKYNSKVKNRNYKFTFYNVIFNKENSFSYKLSCLKKMRYFMNKDLSYVHENTLMKQLDLFLFKNKFFIILVFFKNLRSIF